MIRRLTEEERELWDRLRRSVRPLRPAPADPAPQNAEPLEKEPAQTAAAPSLPKRLPPVQSEPPLIGLEGRARRRLARGLADVDARIDLHGMRQERAFSALFAFLRRSQVRHFRLVLVITGKGHEGEDGRGVLRQSVPAWLARPEFRHLVAGFEEAERRHGGAGALYVRIRRRKDAAVPQG
jgi:DNA-nicking Smr family endonuclease